MLCPRCDGQGSIYKAKVLDLGIELNICDECEACWLKNQPITKESFQDLSTFLKKNGIEYKDAKIKILKSE